MFLRWCWLLVGLACACGGRETTDAGADGGSDGGSDAGLDATFDAGVDSSRMVDAGPDAPESGAMDGAVDDPAWVALPGLPLGCVVERATEPERLFTPEWVSCGEHCSYLARDPAWGWIVDSTGGGVSEGRRYMQVSLSERGRTGAPRIVSLVDVEQNRVVAAWRGPSLRAEVTCAISNLGVGEGHVAFALQMFDATREEAWVFHGPIETMKDVEEPVRKIRDEELPGYGNALQRVYASSTTAAFEVQPLGEVWIVEGGELRRRAGVRSAVPGNPQSLALFGRHVLWNEWRTDVRIAQATFDEEASVYFEVEGARVVFKSDGRDLAWVQGAWIEGEGFVGPVELWTARYERDSGLLEPRRVMENYPYSFLGVVGGGDWVISSSPDNEHRELINLETGSRRRVFAHPQAIWLRPPVWVTGDEIGQVGRWRAEGGVIFDTFFRLSTEGATPID